MSLPFVDANVLLRAILQDHPEHSPRATALLEQIANGEKAAYVTTVVFFEVAFVLQRRAGIDPARVHVALETLLAIDGLRFDERQTLRNTLSLAREHSVPLADAYQAAAMDARGGSDIVSFDRHFDRFPGVERIEP